MADGGGFHGHNLLFDCLQADGGFDETYSVDAWGNVNKYGRFPWEQSYGSNNRIDTYEYDGAGNMLTDGSRRHRFTWDAESRVSSADDGNSKHMYDANGQRLRKTVGSSWTEYISFAGNIIAEKSAAGWKDYIFAGGKRIADTTSDANSIHYYWADSLGSTRIMTDFAGKLVCEDTFAPYGEPVSSNCPTNYRFTGKERDSETGLDYFGARYYASNMGRWMSPDWAVAPTAVPYADLGNPQSLNLYGYVGNNPLSKNDPDGHVEGQWHFIITFVAALKTHHGLLGSLKLAAKTTWVDFRRHSQDTDAEHTNMHAMRGTIAGPPGPDGTPKRAMQTPAQARSGTAEIVSAAIKSGDTPKAIHAVEDQATPGHDGQAWTGVNGSYVKHFIGDNFPSPRTIKQAYENAVQVLQGQNPVPVPASTPPPETKPDQE